MQGSASWQALAAAAALPDLTEQVVLGSAASWAGVQLVAPALRQQRGVKGTLECAVHRTCTLRTVTPALHCPVAGRLYGPGRPGDARTPGVGRHHCHSDGGAVERAVVLVAERLHSDAKLDARQVCLQGAAQLHTHRAVGNAAAEADGVPCGYSCCG